ncbi:MAG: hypothetical protein P1U64_15010 [Alcanivoracaceae bacterium]|jgi:hypothetical protein|nr:hypothetical protein [Alcanivoracaceae bacterium]
MARQQARSPDHDNVVNLFDYRRMPHDKRILRVSPECDGLELLYSNDNHPDKLFSLKVLCWALRDDGEVVAMVPWLDRIMACTELEDPLNGRWEGYRLPESQYMFEDAPAHKCTELQAAHEFFGDSAADTSVVQEIPDTIGTHAVFTEDGFDSISLAEVVSWRVLGNGVMQAMIADEDAVERTPILPGDDCLVPANERADFCYFFQHAIANKIKERDPEALAAISLLNDSH